MSEKAEKKEAPNRNDLRGQIFSSVNQKKAIKSFSLNIYGVDVELRTPTLGDMIKVSEESDIEGRKLFIEQIIAYSFVPGTNEKVFEPGDRDSLVNFPTGEWFSEFTAKIADLTGVDLQKAMDELKKTP